MERAYICRYVVEDVHGGEFDNPNFAPIVYPLTSECRITRQLP